MKKRIVSIVLAVAMLCAILTAFSSASTNVQHFCSACGYSLARTTAPSYNDYRVPSCGYVNVAHDHYDATYVYDYYCSRTSCSLYGRVQDTQTVYSNDVCSVLNPHN